MKTKLIYIITLMLTCSCNNKNANIITKVYVDDKNQNVVLFDNKQKEGNILLNDSNYVYWVIDTIQNNEWVVIERAPSKVGEGRVETENILYYVPGKKEIHLTFSPSNFERRNGVAYLLGSDDKAIPLCDLLNRKSQ
jgi:hypothetical protein